MNKKIPSYKTDILKPKITIEEYLNGRFKEQYEYYNKNSKIYHIKYKFFAVTNLILTSFIPVLSISSDSNIALKYAIAIVGSLATICSGIPLISKYHNSWIKFRLTAEALISEKAKFITRSENYYEKSDEYCNEYFVTQCEKYISEEHEEWISTIFRDMT